MKKTIGIIIGIIIIIGIASGFYIYSGDDKLKKLDEKYNCLEEIAKEECDKKRATYVSHSDSTQIYVCNKNGLVDFDFDNEMMEKCGY